MSHRISRLALLTLLLAGLLGSVNEAFARSPFKQGRGNLSRTAVRGLITKQLPGPGPQERVVDIIGGNGKAMDGYVKMVKLGAASGTDKDIIREIGRSVIKLEKEVGRAKARQFLEDFDDLVDWARRQSAAPTRVAELRGLVADFTKLRSKTFTGAWYELHLAAHFVKNPPPRLVRMQPKIRGDRYLFRDFVIRLPDGTLAFAEAKNFRKIWSRSAIKTLRRQVTSNFDRLRRPPPEPVLNIPPGKGLVFYFNRRHDGRSFPASWYHAIRHQTIVTLMKRPPKGYGFSRANARRWANDHLRFEEVDLVRP